MSTNNDKAINDLGWRMCEAKEERSEARMEINEKDYILGVWYGEKPEKGNLLITVKKQGDTSWYTEARFRFYLDDKTFHSDDHKMFFTKELEGNEQEIEQKIQQEMEYAKREGIIDTIEYVEIKGDIHAFAFKMAMQPWTSIRKENYGDTNIFETGGR